VASGALGFSRDSDAGTVEASKHINDAAVAIRPIQGSIGPTKSTQIGSVMATEGWIRWLPGNAPMAAYMLLTNRGNDPVTLIAASSPRFAQVMLHQSVEKGDMSQMRMVATLVLPPHQNIAIAPGGYHLMLMSPPTPIVIGEQVEVTLEFSDGEILHVTLPVSPPTRTR